MNITEAVESLRKFSSRVEETDGFGLPAYVDTAGESYYGWSLFTLPAVYSSKHYSNYYVEALILLPHLYTDDTWCVLLGSDGSAQLLDRDENKCLLFATLWELER